MKRNDLQEKIRSLVSKNKLQEALDLLYDNCLGKELSNELINLQNRYHQLATDKRNDLKSNEELEQRQNKFVSHLLHINDQVAHLLEDETQRPPSLKEFRTNLEHAIVRVKVSEVLLEAYQQDLPLSVSNIHKQIAKHRNRGFLKQFLDELTGFNFIEKSYNTGTKWKLTKEGKNYLSKWVGN